MLVSEGQLRRAREGPESPKEDGSGGGWGSAEDLVSVGRPALQAGQCCLFLAGCLSLGASVLSSDKWDNKMVPPQWLLLYKVVVRFWPVVICRMFKRGVGTQQVFSNVNLMFY